MNATYKKEYLSTVCSNLLGLYYKKLQESEKNRKSNEKELSKMMETESKSMMAVQEKNMQERDKYYRNSANDAYRTDGISSIPPYPPTYSRHHSMIQYSTEFAASSNSGLRCDALYKKIEKLEAIQSVLNDENSSDITLNDNDISLLGL